MGQHSKFAFPLLGITIIAFIFALISLSSRVWVENKNPNLPISSTATTNVQYYTDNYGLWSVCVKLYNTTNGRTADFGCGFIDYDCNANFCAWTSWNSAACFYAPIYAIGNCSAFQTTKAFMVIYTFFIIVCIVVLFLGISRKKMLGLACGSLFIALCLCSIVIGTQVGANYNNNFKENNGSISDFYNLGWSFWLMITAFVLTFVACIGSGLAFVTAKDEPREVETRNVEDPTPEYHTQATVQGDNGMEMKQKNADSDASPAYEYEQKY